MLQISIYKKEYPNVKLLIVHDFLSETPNFNIKSLLGSKLREPEITPINIQNHKKLIL